MPFNNGRSVYFYPFGTYQYRNVLIDQADCTYPPFGPEKIWKDDNNFLHCYFFDQEPYYDTNLEIFQKALTYTQYQWRPEKINILANSEKSQVKDIFLEQNNMYDWYYFYHGFAALDWYRDFQYVKQSSFDRFTNVFICYNHLISKYRSYRLHLGSNLIEHDLVKHGQVSLFLSDKLGTWQDAIQDPHSCLDARAKVKIYKTLRNVTTPLTIDTEHPTGALSAEIDLEDLTNSLWHIVTETVYFLPKLHLTEKVFKPIIAQRPFILVAAPGNLAYLKSYGFQTFDRWIDESYDLETDNYVRIEKITQEIARLCAMPRNQLEHMHHDMQEVLKFNYDHFYGKFKHIIVDELVDNFAGILSQINNGREPNNHSRYHARFDLDCAVLNEVKQRLVK